MLTTAELAGWLAKHVSAIASSPWAADCYNDVADAVKQIEKVINRPHPPRPLGPCPVVLAENYGQRRCNTMLTAYSGDVEIQCPNCRSTHNVGRLVDEQTEAINAQSFTLKELHGSILPALGEHIPLRTLQHWAATNRLIPTGYDVNGDPRFPLGQVRYLRDCKPQKSPTGAKAHKKRAG